MSLLVKFLGFLKYTALFLAAALAALIIAYRFVEPVSTLMIARFAQGEPVTRDYVPLGQISAALRAAVIISEDAGFCRNNGVDWGALREVVDEADADGPSRGASTITMQTVKNLFLWPSRSFIRKGLEIPLALVLDLAWPKRRVLEVYLNIAEWGEGVFGAEAAARLYFHKSAANLDAWEAALLATALPNPLKRNPAHPGRGHAALVQRLVARLRAAEFAGACVK
ncbi:monofunctional biosynthetic peptidoglycan transglycosylase [Methylocapsa palsarum]|uniref:Biosynthetic peptidoglycan transglycosylase n=1 Tax=Methylocapsa palsarum TaxID=1612308 RepID=A0A1I3XCU4_9HYPH|nr:monofunctional biosynthetic peptidoglycan transglycosylase [Methylocapsa palsarum]